MTKLKKFGPALVVVAILAAFGIFFISGGTTKAPVVELPSATSTEPAAKAPAPAPATPGGAKPSGLVASQVATYPGWDINLRFDLSWTVREQSGLVTVDAPTTTFLIQRNRPIAEPEMVEMKTETRVLDGRMTLTHHFPNPNESYAFYEYFSLQVGDNVYYFKAKSETKSDAELKAFLEGIKVK